MFDEATQEQLQDIQDRADMSNFQNALAAAQADRASGLSAAAQQAQIGQAQQQALTQGLVGREKAATAEQALGQQIRDIGFQEFMEQQEFPKQKLSEYSAIIRGYTPPPNQWQTKDIQQAYSPLQAGIGTAGMLGGLAKGFGLMSKEGGSIPYSKGGGLSSVLRFQDQGSVEEVEVASLSTPIQERASDLQHQQAEALKRQQLANYAEKADAYRSLVETPLDLNQILSDLGIERSTYNERESYDKAVRGVPQRGRYDKSTVGTAIDELLDYGKFGKREGPYDEFKSRDVETFEGPEAVKDLAADIIKPHTLKSPRYMLPNVRKGLRQLMNNRGGPVRMAYGGVPGQAYTEDIGMVGGLGAVAGPQMRFAYGGVPGQAYTEDIGMTGGLAAVAGPQLRFFQGAPIGTPGINSKEDRDKVLASPEYQAFAKQRGEGRAAWRQMLPEGWDPYNTQQILLRDFMDPKRRRKLQEVGTARGERWDALMSGGPDALQKAKAASQRYTDVSKKPTMEFSRELIIDDDEVVKGDNGELHEFDQEDFDVGESGIMPSRTKEKPKPKPQDKPKEKVSPSRKATADKDEMGWRDLLSWGTPLAFQNQYGNVAGQNIARGGGKRLSGTEKEAVQSLVDLRKAQEKDIAAKRSGATLKEVIAAQKDSRDWQHKVMTLYSNLESGNMDRAQKMFTGMDKMQQMALMGILELDEDDREKALMDSGMQIEAIKKLTKQLQGENPLIKFLGGMGNRSTLDSASGGSIPESFKKLGISNIRKV